MIKLTSLLTEVQSFPYWYHGRTVDSDVFSYDYVGGENANDQEGPGFYFVNTFNDAKHYAYPKGVILKCQINYKKLILKTSKSNTKTNKKIITDLILNSPDKEYTLSNFDENPRKAFVNAVNAYLQYPYAHDAYQILARDFYRNDPQSYLRNLSKYYDAQLTDKDGGIFHLIVYKPDIIQVVEKIPYRKEEDRD